MTNHELEAGLRTALHHTGHSADPAQIRETVSLAQASLKAPPKRLSYWGFLGTQVRFIGWKLWLFQAAVLMLMTVLFRSLYHSIFDHPQAIGAALSGCSFLVFLTALPFLYRSKRYQMCELEMATRVSGLRQLGVKLMIIGIGDFSMLLSLFCFALVKTELHPGSLCLYLLLPFLSSTSGLLYLIGHTPVSKLAQNSVVVCAGFFLGFVLLKTIVSSRNHTLAGSIACVLLFFACVYQTHSIFYHSSYEEIQLL